MLEFAALDFQITKHNKYQYKLEGFDQDWSPPSSKRTATYTNLDPGTYTLMVRGSNNDGVWNEEPTKLKINILHPWYQTLWFRILVGVTGAAFILAILQIRTRSIRRQKVVLEKSVHERTIALSEEVQQRQQIEEELRKANLKLQDRINEVTMLKDQLHELAIRDDLTGFV